jgi:hypothetical protein
MAKSLNRNPRVLTSVNAAVVMGVGEPMLDAPVAVPEAVPVAVPAVAEYEARAPGSR